MKYHYFNQLEADPDDQALQQSIFSEVVPPTCLLAGQIIEMAVAQQKDPCKSCQGPRNRCKGRPLDTAQELISSADRQHLRRLFTGLKGESDPIQDIINDQFAPRGKLSKDR